MWTRVNGGQEWTVESILDKTAVDSVIEWKMDHRLNYNHGPKWTMD